MIKRSVNVSDCILDGEVLAYDKENDCYLPFGQNRSVADNERAAYEAGHGEAGWDRDLNLWLAYVVFDIVYVDGPGVQSIISNAMTLVTLQQPAGPGSKSAAGNSNTPAQSPAVVRKREDQMITPLSAKKRAFAEAVGDLPGTGTMAQGEGGDAAAGEDDLGGEITNLPLVVRRRILMDVVRPVAGRVQHVRSQIVSSKDPYTRTAQLEVRT